MHGNNLGLATLLVGRDLSGRYRVEEALGAGGMGYVFEATHLTLGHRVALKILQPHLANRPDGRLRFHREARIAARLTHRSIARVFDFGEDPLCGPFLVMELLSGSPLSRLIDAPRSPTPGQLLRVAEAALGALSVAHEAGVVHRDVKPSNLFLHREEGVLVVKLLDFGVASLEEERDTLDLTGTGDVLGTPRFQAPEQAGGRAVDPRADLFALGATLFAALTGSPPDPSGPPLSSLRPGLPPALVDLILRALAPDPSARPASARAMQAEVVALIDTLYPDASLRASWLDDLPLSLPSTPASAPTFASSSASSSAPSSAPARPPSRASSRPSSPIASSPSPVSPPSASSPSLSTPPTSPPSSPGTPAPRFSRRGWLVMVALPTLALLAGRALWPAAGVATSVQAPAPAASAAPRSGSPPSSGGSSPEPPAVLPGGSTEAQPEAPASLVASGSAGPTIAAPPASSGVAPPVSSGKRSASGAATSPARSAEASRSAAPSGGTTDWLVSEATLRARLLAAGWNVGPAVIKSSPRGKTMTVEVDNGDSAGFIEQQIQLHDPLEKQPTQGANPETKRQPRRVIFASLFPETARIPELLRIAQGR
jgi:serine/threonine protein kinase